MPTRKEKVLSCLLPASEGELFEAMCERCGFTPQDYLSYCVDQAFYAPESTKLGAYITAKLNEGPALALDLSGPDGPTLAAITAAAQRERLSVNEWVLDAIRDKL